MCKGSCPRCRRTGFGYMSEEIRALRDLTGVPYMTLYLLATHVLQLHWAGFSVDNIRRAIKATHPQTMENLTLTPKLKLELVNTAFVWERHRGWVAKNRRKSYE